MKRESPRSQAVLWVIFLMVILPKVPILGVADSTNAIRLDHLGLIPLFALGVPVALRRRELLLPGFGLVLLCLWAAVHLVQGHWTPGALLALVFYLALYLCYLLGKDLVLSGELRPIMLARFIFNLGTLNAVIHLTSLASGWQVSATYQTNLQAVTYEIYGIFGTFGQPYSFCAFLILAFACGTLYLPPRLLALFSPLFLMAVATSESRIGAACFLVTLFLELFLVTPSKRRWLGGILILGVGVALIVGGKVGSILANHAEWGEDPSALLRMANALAYLDRLNAITMSLGFGMLGFLSFVVQYGQPATFDNLYLRIASEFGLVLFGLFLAKLLLFLRKMFLCNDEDHFCRTLAIVMLAMLVVSLFNETMVASKFGYVIWLAVGAGSARLRRPGTGGGSEPVNASCTVPSSP